MVSLLSWQARSCSILQQSSKAGITAANRRAFTRTEPMRQNDDTRSLCREFHRLPPQQQTAPNVARPSSVRTRMTVCSNER